MDVCLGSCPGGMFTHGLIARMKLVLKQNQSHVPGRGWTEGGSAHRQAMYGVCPRESMLHVLR